MRDVAHKKFKKPLKTDCCRKNTLKALISQITSMKISELKSKVTQKLFVDDGECFTETLLTIGC